MTGLVPLKEKTPGSFLCPPSPFACTWAHAHGRMHTHTYAHTHKRSCEHTVRLWLPTSQGERLEDKTYLAKALMLGFSAFRTEKCMFVAEATQSVVCC